MERRTALAKRLELYRSAQVDIDAVAWSKQSDILRMISLYTRGIWCDIVGWRLEKGVRQLVVFFFFFFWLLNFQDVIFIFFQVIFYVIFMYDTFIHTFQMIQERVLFSIRCYANCGRTLSLSLSLSLYIYIYIILYITNYDDVKASIMFIIISVRTDLHSFICLIIFHYVNIFN